MRGRTALQSALTEAYEEAGMIGHPLEKKPIGRYRYRKGMPSGLQAELRVDVFVVLVTELLDDWPERTERVVGWFTASEAASLVAEPGLAKIMLRLPRTLAGKKMANAMANLV